MSTNAAFLPPVEQSDFSGGFTDDPFGNNPRKCLYNDNLFVNPNRKAEQRPGSLIDSADTYQLPSGDARVGRFAKFIDESMRFAQSGRALYWANPTAAWTELQGPASTSAFPTAADQNTRISYGEWQGHLLFANDAGGLPIKVYKDSTGTWQLRTGGLPALSTPDNFVLATATASLVALANDLRTQMLRHFANTGYLYTPHKAVDATSTGYIGAACTDLTTAITLGGQLIKAYDYHYKDSLSGNYYHQKDQGAQTPSGGLPPAVHAPSTMALADTTAPTDIYELAERLNDLRDKYWAHEAHLSPHAQNKANASLGVNPPTLDIVTGVTKGPTAARNYQPLYDWSTQWKSTFNAHLADGPGALFAHSTAADALNPIVAAVGTTRDTLKQFVFSSYYAFSLHELDMEAGAPAYHAATSAAHHFPADNWVSPAIDGFGGVTFDYASTVQQIATLAGLYNAHVQDMAGHFTTDPTFIINQGPGSNFTVANYLYAMHYFYEYTVGDVTYQDFGPVYEFAAESQLAADVYPITIANIPVLANSADTHYDTANIKIRIYRTTSGGTTFYLCGQVSNGTTTFTDNMPDTVLADQETLYTSGGVVENDPPPVAKYVHVTNNKAYYGNVTEDGESRKNRIRQSLDGDPDSCPGDFFVDLDDEVLGISSARTIPIAFTRTGLFRLEGAFDFQGRGAITATAIQNPDSIGLVAENSLIRIENGVLFAGTDGFYFTDGYQIIKLSKGWRQTYLTCMDIMTPAQVARIQGTYDKLTNRAYWAMQRGTGSLDNDVIYVLHLEFGLSEDPCWSSWSNGDHFSPTAILVWQGNLLRGHRRGYVFTHDSTILTDPYVNTDIAPTLWGTVPVRPSYISQRTDLGMGSVRKWGNWLTLNFRNESTNLSLSLISENDDGAQRKNMGRIRMWTNLPWGDVSAPDWGTPGIYWNWAGGYNLKRRFPARSLRFTHKMIEIGADYIQLKQSATHPGPATTNTGTKTVTLDDATYAWLDDCEGYFIRFSDDGYVAEWEILSRVSDTVIQVLDPTGTLPAGAAKAWQIWGNPKNEKFHLLSWAIHAQPLSMSQLASREAQT
jgi:hypothetical protein